MERLRRAARYLWDRIGQITCFTVGAGWMLDEVTGFGGAGMGEAIIIATLFATGLTLRHQRLARSL